MVYQKIQWKNLIEKVKALKLIKRKYKMHLLIYNEVYL